MEAQSGFSSHQDAWQMVLGQLNAEMKRADYNTWISSVEPLGFNGNPDKFRLAVKNYLNKNYLDSRYNGRISRLLSSEATMTKIRMAVTVARKGWALMSPSSLKQA